MSDRAAESRTTEEIASDLREQRNIGIAIGLVDEAADRLQQQAARIAELDSSVDKLRRTAFEHGCLHVDLHGRAIRAEAENERLRAVIERVKKFRNELLDDACGEDGRRNPYVLYGDDADVVERFDAALAETETK